MISSVQFISESIKSNIALASNQYYIIIYIIMLTVMVVASYTDIKKREVADWVNFSLLFSGLGFYLLIAILSSNMFFFIDSEHTIDLPHSSPNYSNYQFHQRVIY